LDYRTRKARTRHLTTVRPGPDGPNRITMTADIGRGDVDRPASLAQDRRVEPADEPESIVPLAIGRVLTRARCVDVLDWNRRRLCEVDGLRVKGQWEPHPVEEPAP